MEEKHSITYNGITINTKFYKELSDAEFEQIRNEYYAKPDFADVKEEFKSISRGALHHPLTTDYYVKDIMVKTRVYYSPFCVEDVFNCKELLSWLVGKTLAFPNIYDVKSKGLVACLDSCISLGGKGIASPTTNFPTKTIVDVLKRFNVNNNWYDMSCGWGDRLLGALSNRVNYYGTDPNYLLTERLKTMANDYKNEIGANTVVDIRTQGSEIFIPEYENKMGLCFTSPPYFYLEDYRIGEQSYKEGVSYQDWLESFLKPTLRNCKAYLIDNGYLAINIKNFEEYKLEQDTIKIAEELGFKLVEQLRIDIIRVLTKGENKGENYDNGENVMVFMKKEFAHLYKKPPQETDLW